MCGSITLITGPMFAGKTTELLRLLGRYHIAGKSCVLIKPAKDTRNENVVGTHGGAENSRFVELSVGLLSDALGELSKYDVIGITEGQFIDDLAPICERLANAGKIIVVDGLIGSFAKTMWRPIIELMPLCDEILRIGAVCMHCRDSMNGIFSTLIADNETGGDVVIGGADKYVTLCRDCRRKHDAK